MPASEQPASALERIDDLDRNIHAPARLKIMACLAVVEEADFTFLLRQTGLTRGNLSPNLRKLEQAGYLAIRKGFVPDLPASGSSRDQELFKRRFGDQQMTQLRPDTEPHTKDLF